MQRKHPDARCEECPLYGNRSSRYAGGSGPDDASIVVLGEAPGYQEAKSGTPFVGPSGKLLDQVLAHHGIDRRRIYVENVVACRPPDNRTPTKKEIQCCYPRAKAEIARRNPSHIVAVGNTAAQVLTGSSDGILSLRVGGSKRSPDFPETEVIATVHPAYCLRSGDAFPYFVNDIGKINNPLKEWRPPKWAAIEDPQDAVSVIQELNSDKYRELVVDIECSIEKDSAYDHPDHYKMLCIGFAYADGKAVVIGSRAIQDQSVKDSLRELFGNARKEWIAHNGKFDFAALASWGMEDNLHFDTMLASYALDERPGTNSLGYCAVEELGTPDWKDVVKPYIGKDKNYSLIPKKILYQYNAYDVACTWDLKKLYEPRLKEEGLMGLHDFLCEASLGLKYAEMAGVGVDIDVLDELTDEYLDILGGLEKQLSHWVANPRSWQQVAEALKDLKLKANNTAADTLQRLYEGVAPDSEAGQFLGLMLEHRKAAKFYGTYVKGIRQRLRQGMVHTSFLVHGTTTGRLSSRNPNLQNVPRGPRIRRMFVPADGNVFVQADYGQIELRIAAVLSGDAYLQGIFNDTSRDMFDELGVALYGPIALDPKHRKELRIRTKAYVYGVNYGRSAYDIAKEHKIPQNEAQKGIDTYFRLAHRLNDWRKEIMNQILDDKAPDLETPFGRKRRFWLITSDNQQDTIKQGLAFIPQSTASDINLLAATRLRLDYELDVRILVHDSTLVECKEEEADSTAALMERVMSATATEIMGDSIPFIVESEIGKNWGFV